VNAAAARAAAIAGAVSGFVGGDKRDIGSGNSVSTATMELRVPADKFAATLDQLAKELGREESRSVNTEDVTEQVVDLDARIATQQARVASGRKLLSQAKDLDDLVMLEKEVATRESDLASLQAKKTKLADLTALSTITLSLVGPAPAAPPADDNPAGFLAGLSSGWHGLLTSLGVLAAVLGWLLPWIVVIGLPAGAVLWTVKRRRPLKGSGS
jgi:hypothetical protein